MITKGLTCHLAFRQRSAGRRIFTLALVAVTLQAAAGCSTYRKMPVEEKRAQLAELEETTLEELVERFPEAQTDVDNAVGYAIFTNRATKVPVVGAGEGIGVVVDSQTGERTFLKVERLDVGGGLGVRTYRVVTLFFDREALHELAQGKTEIGAGVEAGSGTSDVGTGAGGVAGSRNEKYAMYQLSESGVSATFTVRATRYSVLDLEE